MTGSQCAASARCQGKPHHWHRGLCRKHYRAWAAVNRPVDSEIVRAHIARLRDAGIGCIRIAQLAGVSPRTISRIAGGHSKSYTYADRARAILAVNPAVDRPFRMDPTGASRRLRALVAMGYTQPQIRAALPTAKPQIQRYLVGTASGIRPETHDQIDAAFQTLSVQSPPTGGYADRAREIAARRGFLPALAWDLETIDDPAAEPFTDAVRRPPKLGDVLEDFRLEYLELRDEFRLTDTAIAERIGITDELLLKRLSRLKIPTQQSQAAS